MFLVIFSIWLGLIGMHNDKNMIFDFFLKIQQV